MEEIGNSNILMFSVGEYIEGSTELKVLDIWLCNECVTSEDNVVFDKAIVSAAEYDLNKQRDFDGYSEKLQGMSVLEMHTFISETRNPESKNFKFGDDIFMEFQVFDWGSNTDHVISFLLKNNINYFLTLEFLGDRSSEPIRYFEIDINYFHFTLKSLISKLNS